MCGVYRFVTLFEKDTGLLNLFKSNRMENLVKALGEVLDRPLDDPMMPEWIGVQSQGMKQWVSTTLARRFGICANIRFSFLKDMVEQILNAGNNGPETHKPFTDKVLLYGLMDTLNDLEAAAGEDGGEREVFSPILSYLAEGTGSDPGDSGGSGLRQYQVCDRLARLFDDYQVYRPDMLSQWQIPEYADPNRDPQVSWQAGLFSELVKQGFDQCLGHRIKAIMEKGVETGDLLCERINLFGISSMPPAFLEVFSRVAQTAEVNLFLLTPSREFFGYIRSDKEQSRIADREERRLQEAGNPILASMGKPSREFHLLCEDHLYHEPFPDLFEDPASKSASGRDATLLEQIQSDILNLVDRTGQGDHDPVTFDRVDDSFRIHACHTPLREAEALKDQLLCQLAREPDVQPHDIIVMMPDIESYSPYIEAVFGTGDQIPYTIADRVLASEYELVAAVLKILKLKQGRFELLEVLDLLESRDIAGRFGILPSDMESIESMCRKAGIFWGRDADHRKQTGLPGDHENTWAFGLQRLMLGLAMPERQGDLVLGMAPCAFLEGLEADLLGRFAAFCHTLFDHMDRLAGPHTMIEWCDILLRLVSAMVIRNTDNEAQYTFVIRTLDGIRDQSAQAGFKKAVNFEVMAAILEKELSRTLSSSRFMAGKVTFCNIMPMRSIPFKVVALMGMNETDFPRKGIRDSFDLIKAHPRPGDKVDREEDRNLFLEALLSARRSFRVTYTGMDIRDNSPIPASPVVTELVDMIHAGYLVREPGHLVVEHPLHGFNERYFSDDHADGIGRSYSRNAYDMALRLRQGTAPVPPFLDPSEPVADSTDKVAPEGEKETISIDTLVRFFNSPLAWFMKHTLGLVPMAEENRKEDREPDRLDGLGAYALGTLMTDHEAPLRFEQIKALGVLPHGQKGVLEYEEISGMAGKVVRISENIRAGKPISLLRLNAEIEGYRITGVLPQTSPDEAFWLTYGRLSPKRLLNYWIHHLVLNCSSHDGPFQTVMVGRSPDDPSRAVSLSFPDIRPQAGTYLAYLIQRFTEGRTSPMIFFPATSWAYTNRLMKTGDPESADNQRRAVQAASKIWYDPFRGTGDKTDRYAAIYFRQTDLFDSADDLTQSGFLKNSMEILGPLMSHLAEFSGAES